MVYEDKVRKSFSSHMTRSVCSSFNRTYAYSQSGPRYYSYQDKISSPNFVCSRFVDLNPEHRYIGLVL